MSATNRGGVRIANDYYPTPKWLTKAILPHLHERLSHVTSRPFILEPACGDGAIVDVLKEAWGDRARKVVAVDIAPGSNAAYAMQQDFLTLPPEPIYDLIITNPPFSLCREFCARAMEWANPNGVVAMLARLNFLGSKKRAAWLREFTPSIYITPRRPSFSSGGTDNCEYAWLVWGGTELKPTVQILETENV